MRTEILCSFRLLVEYANRLAEDIPAEHFTDQTDGVHNHPAWILGHLSCSFQAIGGELGLAPWLPDEYPLLFGTGSIPTAEPTDYPPKSQLLATFRDAVERIEMAVDGVTDERLASPLPDEEYRKVLPTLGGALVHILIGHASIHVGQLTVWRGANGLPRVAERFDRR
jgi:hypothetical protein